MKYQGPIRPEPSLPSPPRWWPVLLTLLCAGGLLLIYWLAARHIVNADTITLGIVIIVPVATFVLADHRTQAFFRKLLCKPDTRTLRYSRAKFSRREKLQCPPSPNDPCSAKSTAVRSVSQRNTEKHLRDRQ